MRKLLLLLLLTLVTPTEAKLLQIIHTNDLHSYFEGERTGFGGYARIRTVVKQLREEAEAKGIPTLFLDGGDFGEGSSYYFADHGVSSLKALEELGVDVAVLGNHDYMTGGRDLARQIREANMKTKIISANLKGKRFRGLRKLLPAYVDFDFEGLHVRVFGLTTSELHYQYPLLPVSYISPSHKAGINQAEKAQRHGVDFLIALTHIGLDKDIRLVTHSRTIDLVVGGHSHDHLGRAEMIKNLEGREIPVLQAGAHALYVGSLIIDAQPEGMSRVMEYKSVHITQDIPEDPSMKNFVEAAKVKRETYFKRPWDEVIGLSEIDLSGSFNGNQIDRRTCWSRHIARLTRKIAKADLGLQLDEFQGERIPKGPITFGDMVDNFPHFRKWGDRGWKIARATVNGWVLKKVIKELAESEAAIQITLDGIEAYDEVNRKRIFFDLLKHDVHEAIVNEDSINGLRYYTIGFPSEVPFAMIKSLNVLAFVLLNNLSIIEGSDY